MIRKKNHQGAYTHDYFKIYIYKKGTIHHSYKSVFSVLKCQNAFLVDWASILITMQVYEFCVSMLTG